MTELEENSNSVLLRETKETQNRMLETLDRTLRQAAEIEEVGKMTVESLVKHDEQLDTILEEAARTRETLKKTDKLQNKFARWSLRFGNRRRARKAQRKGKTDCSVKGKVCSNLRTKEKDDKAILNKKNKELNILFGKLAHKIKNEPTRPEMKSNNKRCVELPLSLDDEKYLHDIAITEEHHIDPALDALGEQLDGLMSLSLSMNESINKEEYKLNTVEKKLDKLNNRVNLANLRIAVDTT